MGRLVEINRVQRWWRHATYGLCLGGLLLLFFLGLILAGRASSTPWQLGSSGLAILIVFLVWRVVRTDIHGFFTDTIESMDQDGVSFRTWRGQPRAMRWEEVTDVSWRGDQWGHGPVSRYFFNGQMTIVSEKATIAIDLARYRFPRNVVCDIGTHLGVNAAPEGNLELRQAFAEVMDSIQTTGGHYRHIKQSASSRQYRSGLLWVLLRRAVLPLMGSVLLALVMTTMVRDVMTATEWIGGLWAGFLISSVWLRRYAPELLRALDGLGILREANRRNFIAG